MILFKAEAIFASNVSTFGKFLLAIDREDLNSSTESTISTSLIHHIASEENQNKESPGFWILSSNIKMTMEWWIYQIEVPIFAVFTVQP